MNSDKPKKKKLFFEQNRFHYLAMKYTIWCLAITDHELQSVHRRVDKLTNKGALKKNPLLSFGYGTITTTKNTTWSIVSHFNASKIISLIAENPYFILKTISFPHSFQPSISHQYIKYPSPSVNPIISGHPRGRSQWPSDAENNINHRINDNGRVGDDGFQILTNKSAKCLIVLWGSILYTNWDRN